jgi:hypothetical protein
MKTVKRSLQFVIIFLLAGLNGPNLSAQNLGINTTGALPDASAMLDVVSASKGLLIPRVNLSSLSDGATITSPATSLLVFNTNAALPDGTGFYFNSGNSGSPAWTKLVTSNTGWKLSGNAGTTAGTDFIGTTDAQGFVIKTNGSQRINISSSGNTVIGDATNHTLIEADGTIMLEGSATAYNDIVVPLFNSRLGNDRQPTWSPMKNDGGTSRGIYTFTFEDQSSANNEQEVFFSVQMPHNWKEGTTVYPHVHWAPQAATAGNVVWGLEYTWVNYDATTPLTFANTTIITATSADVAFGDVDKHLITAFSSITPSASQNKISSILMCRFFRKSADSNDDYNGNAAVLSFDLHYEIDAVGSHSQYVK